MLAKRRIGNITGYGNKSPVYESIKRYSLHGLSELIRVLMENIDDSLFALSDKAESDRERNMYFEAMREIRLKRQAIQLGFDQEMKQCFNLFSQNQSRSELDEDPEELTLIELDDFEDSIAIDNMISKARPHFEDELFAVEERLKAILHRKDVNQDLNPLDPKAICDSFHNAAEVIDAEIQIKLIFYKMFDKYVMNNLGHFYSELNQFFIEKNVLPEFKASLERKKQTTQFMANRINKNPSSAPASSNVESPGPNEGQPLQKNGGAGDLLSMFKQLINSGTTTAVANPGSVSHADRWEPGGGLIETYAGPGVAPAAGTTGYVSALTGLQSTNLNSAAMNSTNPQVIRAELQQQLVTFNNENAHQANADDSQVIDIVSMLFEFFFDDEAIPDPIKVLIGRLQIPILKVAILDKSFFNRKKHPARKLLDSISKAALGWGQDQEHEALLTSRIEKIVNFLLTEFEEDIAVFDQALEELTTFLDEQKEKEKVIADKIKQKELEKEQELITAQETADALIQKLMANREFNFAVTDFFESIWASVLFNIYLKMGHSSNHWKNIRRISSIFIWTLVPKHSEEERLRILETLPYLLRAISHGMELIQIPIEEKNRIFQVLAKEHANIVKQTSKNIVTRIDDKTTWPEDNVSAAFAGYTKELASEEIDIEFFPDPTGEIQIIQNEDDLDSITNINIAETNDVIHDLEQFTAGVQKGEILVEEEIILDSAEQANYHAVADTQSDDFLELAQSLELGTWIEFIEEDESIVKAKLSWKSNVTGKLVFVNRQGHKIKKMTSFGLATVMRSSRATLIESTSFLDRAFDTIISSIKP